MSKFIIFPPKNLEKYGRLKYACANFLFAFLSQSNLKIFYFPAKKLREKSSGLKYACAVYFSDNLFITVYRFSLNFCFKDVIFYSLNKSNKYNIQTCCLCFFIDIR